MPEVTGRLVTTRSTNVRTCFEVQFFASSYLISQIDLAAFSVMNNSKSRLGKTGIINFAVLSKNEQIRGWVIECVIKFFDQMGVYHDTPIC